MKKKLIITLLSVTLGFSLFTAIGCTQLNPNLPACKHEFGDWQVEIKPTCATEGKKVRVCEKCGETEQATLPETNEHVETVIPATEATCTETGLTEGKKCSVCGTTLVRQEVIPAGHIYENGFCTRCGSDESDEYFTFTLLENGTYSIVKKDFSRLPEKIIIPSAYKNKAVTSIGEDAFKSCFELTNITIPDSVTSIGKSAFSYCSGLTNITIPNSVTSIGDSAFYHCGSLERVTIGENVKSIPAFAFYDCRSLTSINFNGTMGQWNAITKGSDWNYGVPATEVICSDGSISL